MQQAKSLLNELVAAGRPMSLEDFNLYVFRGLRGEFKDLVTSLVAHVRRRGDRPPTLNVWVCLENIGRQGILVSYQWNK
jgi:hypothetical protein